MRHHHISAVLAAPKVPNNRIPGDSGWHPKPRGRRCSSKKRCCNLAESRSMTPQCEDVAPVRLLRGLFTRYQASPSNDIFLLYLEAVTLKRRRKRIDYIAMEPRACDAISFGSRAYLHWHRSFSSTTCSLITVIVRGEPSLMITPACRTRGTARERPGKPKAGPAARSFRYRQ